MFEDIFEIIKILKFINKEELIFVPTIKQRKYSEYLKIH